MERYSCKVLIQQILTKLHQAMDETGVIVFLSDMVAILYFFFKTSGIKVNLPLALVCKNETEFSWLLDVFASKHIEEEQLSWWKRKDSDYLECYRDRLVGAYLIPTKENEKPIEKLLTDILEGDQNQIVVLGFLQAIPPKFYRDVLPITINSFEGLLGLHEDIEEWHEFLIRYGEESGARILGILKRFTESEDVLEPYPWLYAAIDILHELCGTDSQELIVELRNSLIKGIDYAENLQDYTGWSEAVIDLLYHDAESGRRPAMVERYDTERVRKYAQCSVPYYDEKFYYYSDEQLREICEPLLEIVSFPYLNHVLAEEGIQTKEESLTRCYFTSRVLVHGLDYKHRPRFHRIFREAVRRIDDESLEELYNAGGADDKSNLPG